MPEFFGSQHSGKELDNTDSKFSNENNTITVDQIDTSRADSYNGEELTDPNTIVVTIADDRTPLVLLVGPPSCGKTMTLIRLARYLRTLSGYTIQPVTSFRPAHDKNYERMCAQFDAMISNDYAADSTSQINFMLVKILYKGKALCQILEAPGEHYYKPEKDIANMVKKQFPRYISKIKNCNNRKIWAVIVEPDHTNKSMDTINRAKYAMTIRDLVKLNMRSHDKVMFIFNKIDETPYVIAPGRVNQREALREIANLYPNIFVPFKNENPITRFWKENNFDFIPFQTGEYAKAADGSLAFEPGHDIYPATLWNTISKLLKG